MRDFMYKLFFGMTMGLVLGGMIAFPVGCILDNNNVAMAGILSVPLSIMTGLISTCFE